MERSWSDVDRPSADLTAAASGESSAVGIAEGSFGAPMASAFDAVRERGASHTAQACKVGQCFETVGGTCLRLLRLKNVIDAVAYGSSRLLPLPSTSLQALHGQQLTYSHGATAYSPWHSQMDLAPWAEQAHRNGRMTYTVRWRGACTQRSTLATAYSMAHGLQHGLMCHGLWPMVWPMVWLIALCRMRTTYSMGLRPMIWPMTDSMAYDLWAGLWRTI